MKKAELLARIEALEKRVQLLEVQQPYIFIPYQYPIYTPPTGPYFTYNAPATTTNTGTIREAMKLGGN